MTKLKPSFFVALLGLSLAASAHAKAKTPAQSAAKYDFFQASAIIKENSKFVRAIRAAGLTPLLRGKNPITILAPGDAAWDQLPAGVEKALFLPKNKALLASVVKYHFLPGRVDAIQLTESSRPKSFKTMNGENVIVAFMENEGFFFRQPTPLAQRGKLDHVNLVLRNGGYSHAITVVLLPPSVLRALPQLNSSQF